MSASAVVCILYTSYDVAVKEEITGFGYVKAVRLYVIGCAVLGSYRLKLALHDADNDKGYDKSGYQADNNRCLKIKGLTVILIWIGIFKIILAHICKYDECI